MRWLIDGHNLIGQLPNIYLHDPHDEAKLLELLRRYRAKTGHTITVVFDSGLSYRPGATKKQGGITIQFAPSGQSADQLIIRRIRKVKNPQAVMVVTADRVIRQAAAQAGIRVLNSREFAQQLLQDPSGAAPHDAGSQAEINLSPDEIEEWLNIFNQTDE